MSFINQNRIKNEITAMSKDFIIRGGLNLLLQGSAGCGKTTLANRFCMQITPNEYYARQIPVSGNLNMDAVTEHRVNLIDEIHELHHYEQLYPFMDNENKVFVFCTTEYGNLPEPFLTRCTRLTFDSYSIKDLTKMAKDYATHRGFRFYEPRSYELIAQASRGSPRLVRQRFDRVKLMLRFYHKPPIAKNIEDSLNEIGILSGGYTTEDFNYLKILESRQYSSIQNLSRMLKIDRNTIEKEIEPFLLENGNIEITSKGRKFTRWPYLEPL